MKPRGRILIVDDIPANVDILRRLLRKEYELATAASGEECLALIPSFKPQLVLLDIMMPGIDGCETCRRIKSSAVGDFVQVILISGKPPLRGDRNAVFFIQPMFESAAVKWLCPHVLHFAPFCSTASHPSMENDVFSWEIYSQSYSHFLFVKAVSLCDPLPMGQVTYDGEEVVFQGPLPQSVDKLVDIFSQTAASQGKMLLSIKVNGQEMMGRSPAIDFDPNARVEVLSGSVKELFLSAIDTTTKDLPDADAALDPILEGLLCESWTDAFNRLNAFMRGMAPLLELLSNLSQYAKNHDASWKSELNRHLGLIDNYFKKILSLSEKQQTADLASLLNFEFRPAYADILSFVKTTVKNSFKS